MYEIISDGGCDFSKEEALLNNITVVPFYISFDQVKHLKEGVDISREEFFKKLISEKNLFPKTSQPNPQDWLDIMRPKAEAGLDIILVTISSKLSGSYNSAQLAAGMLREEFPNCRVVLFDSLNCSVGQGLILREIIKMRNSGYTLEESTRLAEEVRASTHIYFTLDTLEYLKRGGRVGPTTALVGGILGLRPILQLVNGEISQLDSVRGKKKALQLIEEGIVFALQNDAKNINMSIGHILNATEAKGFGSRTEAALGIKLTGSITDVGAAIGTHTGPGAMAFAYCRKLEALLEKRGAA